MFNIGRTGAVIGACFVALALWNALMLVDDLTARYWPRTSGEGQRTEITYAQWSSTLLAPNERFREMFSYQVGEKEYGGHTDWVLKLGEESDPMFHPRAD